MLHMTHTALTILAKASEVVDFVKNRGPVMWVRQQFAWEEVGSYGVWGYWRNRLTGKRIVRRIRIEGTTQLNRTWLMGCDWDHAMYPMGSLGYENMNLAHVRTVSE